MVKSQQGEGKGYSFEQDSGPSAPSTPSLYCPSIHPDFEIASISPTPLGPSSFSSTSSYTSLPTSPKNPKARACPNHAGHEVLQTRPSLQQHLQHSDAAGREEAMQSFILERFLPAAQAVAADHDHGNYSSSKSNRMIPPSSSAPKLTLNGPSPSFSSQRASLAKGAAWSRATCLEEMELESVDNDPSSKACGFFRVGFKNLLSRMHNTVHSSEDSVSRRVASSCVQRTSSSGEFDLGRQKQCRPDQAAFTSSSRTIAATKDVSWRSIKSPDNSFPRDGNINKDGSSLQNRWTSCSFDSEHERDSSFEAVRSVDPHHASSGALDIEGGSLHINNCETQWVAENVTEDEEPEFYDASSQLDSISCNGSITPYSGCDFHDSFEMDSLPSCSNHEEPVVFLANHATYSSTLPSSVMFSCLSNKLSLKVSVMDAGTQEQEGIDCLESPLAFEGMARKGHDLAHSIQRTLEASPILPEKTRSRYMPTTTYTGFKPLQRFGWPLGLQSSTKKPFLINNSDKTSRMHHNYDNVAAPLVPPAPSSSWLGKALALNASKPSSMLGSLQQREKGKSARSELKFTPSDAAKEVRWEDVVKESQMHLRFSEDPWNHHPSSHKAARP